jgi:hypothetical protein
MRGLATTVTLLLAVGACSAGGGGAVEGGVHDALYEVSLDLPAGCPPDAGNTLGIGVPCTRGGHQCGGSTLCTCDNFLGVQLVGVPCFCTLAQLAQTGSTDPCGPPLSSTFCGDGAKCCPYQTAAAYCVPNICLPGGMCPPTGP